MIRWYNYLFSSKRHFARRMRSITGFTPASIQLFERAFLHRSNQTDDAETVNNERLEYLGDAVLGTIVADYLFRKYPRRNEGFMTKMRSKIVKRKTLNLIAEKMALDDHLQEFNNNRLSRSMMGNALEALVGAVYLDTNYKRTYNFVVHRMLRKYVNVHRLETYDDNYKSQLLEYCQKRGKSVVYRVVARYKQQKRDRFKVAVLIDDKKLAEADDFNKKSAEQMASEKALHTLGVLSKSVAEV